MTEAQRNQLLRRSLSSWRRVGVAAVILVSSAALYVLSAQVGLEWAGYAIFAPSLLVSFLFLFGSLAITAIYKLAGGFGNSDRFLGDQHNIMLVLLIREEI